jgi:hypothetical protein
VEELLIPKDDSANSHKMEQLKELAIYNGTYRDLEACTWCGMSGHKQWECPKKRSEQGSTTSNIASARVVAAVGAIIVCAICGERSHPTMDCPNRDKFNNNNGMMGDGNNNNGSGGEEVDATTTITTTSGEAPSAAPVEDPEYLNFLNEI